MDDFKIVDLGAGAGVEGVAKVARVNGRLALLGGEAGIADGEDGRGELVDDGALHGAARNGEG